MSEFLLWELQKIGMSIVFGCVVATAYDVLRILRRLFPHNTVAFSVEDLLYFICLAPITYGFVLRINDGIFRVYIVLGIIMGVFIYRETLGRLIVYILSLVLGKIIKFQILLLKKISQNIKINIIKYKEKRRRQREKKQRTQKDI